MNPSLRNPDLVKTRRQYLDYLNVKYKYKLVMSHSDYTKCLSLLIYWFYYFKEWPAYVVFLEKQKHFQVSCTVILEECCIITVITLGIYLAHDVIIKTHTSAVFQGCKLMRSEKERKEINDCCFEGMFPNISQIFLLFSCKSIGSKQTIYKGAMTV